ncbi:MAG: sigma-54-dependent Fis family transcriptional regulator [Waddliaceae bacterium]|nr:sigma-54-dependent Fis family transcriptional regulator [Waddliaceae bacterium]MBT3578940.1 sigma-54-dependent Fis family transcriptional regulator [Waddliaceae bacterium]MBT4445501.1 sigma-54-dependent Fis family transcriptional regulator [Waddliaceae bacterium]MBT6928992.1 sigma-54-dependent Fis family transcriptional regulator [Waddliaceae bacterium]MBT7263990.1 sigma-54-dependent Fis family transcriptional regulator [Waddliaceae bacterium]
MAIEKILVVDDEILIRSFLEETLSRKGFDVTTAEDGKEGISLLVKNSYDLIITDMKMPRATGMDVLRKAREVSPSTLVVIITAFGSIDSAVEAMRLGAFNYILKPFSPDTIEAVLVKAQEHISLVEENRFLKEEVSSGSRRGSSNIIAESDTMKKVLDDASRVAASNASVFISGESGTGKEVMASFIHSNSPRSHKPFIRVNCAAIPESLVESEFFGHEKGAFTGANSKRLGRFELANNGTLLLDEVTEIPPGLQAKLLRVVQEQEFERVGGSKLVTVDVRLISTSNRKMEDAIAEGIFREDLFYRLNVIPIHLPPLRDRREDIVPLAEHFLESFCIENHKKKKSLASDAKKLLIEYHWPGNIRELANIIERAVVMDYSDAVAAEHLNIGVIDAAKAKLQALSKHATINSG